MGVAESAGRVPRFTSVGFSQGLRVITYPLFTRQTSERVRSGAGSIKSSLCRRALSRPWQLVISTGPQIFSAAKKGRYAAILGLSNHSG